MTNEELLKKAQDAVEHVKKSCPIGAGNKKSDIIRTGNFSKEVMERSNQKNAFIKNLDATENTFDITLFKEEIRELLASSKLISTNTENILTDYQYTKNQSALFIYEGIAKNALRDKVGNCAGQSSIAFFYLLRTLKLTVPIELVGSVKKDHLFVVINRDANSDIQKPTTWNEKVAICDPWEDYSCLLEKKEAARLEEKYDDLAVAALVQNGEIPPLNFFDVCTDIAQQVEKSIKEDNDQNSNNCKKFLSRLKKELNFYQYKYESKQQIEQNDWCNVVELLQFSWHDKGISLRFDQPKKLPADLMADIQKFRK